MFIRHLKYIRLMTILLLISALLVGCGYTPTPILPEHIKKISVATFVNKTVSYGLEEKLTNAVVDEFLRDGRLDIVRGKEADAILSGEITQYVQEPISYDEQDVVEEYKLWISVDLAFKDLTNNTVLWEHKGMEGSVNYFVSSNAGEFIETEDEAQIRLVEDLSEDIVRRTIEGW